MSRYPLEYQVRTKYHGYSYTYARKYKRLAGARRRYNEVLKTQENTPDTSNYKLEYVIIESRPSDDWAVEYAWFDEGDKKEDEKQD